jgi:predicted O-methyltransferase YrrM
MSDLVAGRGSRFHESSHSRYWWYRLSAARYVPPIIAALTDDEWRLMESWFEDTERTFPNPGEISVPGMSLLSALIGGNGLSRIVQLGHYVGYSTLLLGFLLRSMQKKHALFSVDIDPIATGYTQRWVERGDLTDVTKLVLSDSAISGLPEEAAEYLHGRPQLVFIDSSHQYQHTLVELELWYQAVQPGGFILMHDASKFAQSFDITGNGGVLSAIREWSTTHGIYPLILNESLDETHPIDELVYRDRCGVAVIQKPLEG